MSLRMNSLAIRDSWCSRMAAPADGDRDSRRRRPRSAIAEQIHDRELPSSELDLLQESLGTSTAVS
jgi:hypothetical protein